MKSFLFVSSVVALLFLLPGRSSAQTSICSFQTRARFTLAGSPYTITCDYTIPAGDSLVIDPRVQVITAGHSITVNGAMTVGAGVRLDMNSYGIAVAGRLRVLGTQSDSVFVNASSSFDAIHITNTGRSSLAYMSYRNVAANSTSLIIDDGLRTLPTVSNCRFYSLSSTTDIYAGLTTTAGLHNVMARLVVVKGSTGQSGRLVAYKSGAAYRLAGSVSLSPADSLVVESGVRLDLAANIINVDGKLRLKGTQRDSVFLTSNGSSGNWSNINITNTGTCDLAYMSYRNTVANGTSLLIDDGQRAQPKVNNCRFYGLSSTTDIYAGLTTTGGLRNVMARLVVVKRSTGQSGRLVAYKPGAAYKLDGSISLSPADSLVVESGVRLDLAANIINVDGKLRLKGTQRDSVFLTSNGSSGNFGNIHITSTGTSNLAYMSYRNAAANGTSLVLDNGAGQSIHDCYLSGDNGMFINIRATQTLRLDHLKFADFLTAMAVPSGNVTVSNSLFEQLKPKFGINATGTSTVNAINCYFDHPTGPYNPQRNPNGLGCQVTGNVNLTTASTLAPAQYQENFRVYPNPSFGKFTLESNIQRMEAAMLEVKTMLGSTVYCLPVTIGHGIQSRELDLSNLPPGVYLLRLQTSEGAVVKKLMKN